MLVVIQLPSGIIAANLQASICSCNIARAFKQHFALEVFRRCADGTVTGSLPVLVMYQCLLMVHSPTVKTLKTLSLLVSYTLANIKVFVKENEWPQYNNFSVLLCSFSACYFLIRKLLS
jgi:hypothetical protein